MPMKYYRYDDEYSPLGGGITYVETQDGTNALRQITVFRNQIHASNMRHPLYGFNLAEKPLEYDKFDEVLAISQQEFDGQWRVHLNRHASDWGRAKRRYRPGSRVEGFIEIFYPQGVIVNIGSKFLGLANYAECKASTALENMSTRHKVVATLKGYDEENHWFLLASPSVLPERVN